MPDTLTVPALDSLRNQNLRVRQRRETLSKPLSQVINVNGWEAKGGSFMTTIPIKALYVLANNPKVGP